MAEVKVLIEGFTSADDPEGKTCPTITLIKDNNKNIICDPGILEDQQILINKLKENNLTIDDIDIVFITHSHIDHYRNIGMFPNALTLEYYGLWNKQTVHDWNEHFTEDIRIINTPGHSYDSLTLLVKTKKGIIAVCGDVFWKKDYPEEDMYALDKEELKKSRKLVLKEADWIVPGHANIYKSK